MGAAFWPLYGRALACCGATFALSCVLLLADIYFRPIQIKKRGHVFHWRVGHVFRTAFFVTLVLWVGLNSSAVRRSTTDASAFDAKQMWWHSLFSGINIVLLLIINKFLARQSLSDLGYPHGGVRRVLWTLFSPVKQLRRFLVVMVIVLGTHLITPVVMWMSGCVEKFDFIDYSKNSFYLEHGVIGLIYFFALQQFCFAINGIDEESSWRGFTNALWTSDNDRHATWIMYVLSGWQYAMLHSLNTPFEFSRFSVMVANLVFEGGAWMFLYRSSKDLVQNWILHDVDDLFSIWFGGMALAGYELPAGQIVPFVIGCQDSWWVSGGDFGTGGSLLYLLQNLYTVLVILSFITGREVWRRNFAKSRLPDDVERGRNADPVESELSRDVGLSDCASFDSDELAIADWLAVKTVSENTALLHVNS